MKTWQKQDPKEYNNHWQS